LVQLERWGEKIGLGAVYAKLEFAGPTGSFKDRGAAVLVSHAVATGAQRVIEDSSGNAGAAVAAYAARAGLECQIFAPAATPAAKLAQIRAYGADLVAVKGSRQAVAECARAAAEASRGPGDSIAAYYAGHNSNPYFVEGTKTFALELAEQFDAVEHIVMPVGGGSLFCGTALGFEQMRTAGLVRTVPRLHLVQAEACAPLVAAFERGASQPVSVERRPTIAGGITIERPERGQMILSMLRDSNGSAVAVGEPEIEAALDHLARLEGIYMEPTSAAAFAGLAKLAALGVIEPNQSVVVPVTGSGLKDIH
jgi:threonine synthase